MGDKVVPLQRGQASLTKLWIDHGLTLKNNRPNANTDTICTLLTGATPHWKNLHYDSFYQCLMRDVDVPMKKYDPLELLIYMQRNMGVDKATKLMVEQAIEHTAYQKQRNCVQDWLNKLPAWDNVDRITNFFIHYYKAEPGLYARACGQNFWRGLVARALNPGCQFDNVIVIEGKEGIKKSKSLEVLCPWFAAISADKIDVEFYRSIQGKLLIEIDEMQTFSAASAESVRSAITRRTDRFRSPYDRMPEDHPRQCLFVVTLNPGADFIRDVGGGRRWWPIHSKRILLDELERDRDQLYAQALHDIKAGVPYWIMPEKETKAEQYLRREFDPWEPYVRAYVMARMRAVTVNEILVHSEIKCDPAHISRKESNKITAILRAIGWQPGSGRAQGVSQKVWTPPVREPGQDDEED